jgi:hypothetical protein
MFMPHPDACRLFCQHTDFKRTILLAGGARRGRFAILDPPSAILTAVVGFGFLVFGVKSRANEKVRPETGDRNVMGDA